MRYTDLNSISKSTLPGYSRIYALNNYHFPPKKDVFHKYIPLGYLYDYISNDRITFVSPSTWNDPYETRYYQLDYKKIGYNEPSIFCMCLTDKQSQNEDAMWIRYARPGDEMVKINLVIEDLLDLLEAQGEKMDFNTYIGEVIYISKTGITGITKKNSIFFPKNFDIEHYLTLMSLKRGAFAYENEIRIFIVPEDGYDNLLFHVLAPNITSIINKITVSPYPVVYNPFPNPDSMTYLNVRKTINEKTFTGIIVEASRLFEDCSKCKL